MIQCRILDEKQFIRKKRVVKGAFYTTIIIAIVFLGTPIYATLTGTDREVLSQTFRGAGFSIEEIEPLLRDDHLTLYPEILSQKAKGFNYLHPRFGLLSRSSIERGQRVLKKHRTTLKRVEAAYGVPREVLVAIFRVETNLGSNLGRYRVFNSLLTLTVIVNRRSAWAGQELVNFLVLCKNNRINPFSIKGSSAGAFGLCQFVPSSYLAYGADGNGDSIVDLFEFSDAMASTANYLRSHGWNSRDTAKQFQAVMAYNRCENYVKAVLSYSKKVKLGSTVRPSSVRKWTEDSKSVGLRGQAGTRVSDRTKVKKG